VENLAILGRHGLEVCCILLVEAAIYVLLLALQRRKFLSEELVRTADKILFWGAISQVTILVLLCVGLLTFSGYKDLYTKWLNVREASGSVVELRAGLAEQQRQIDALKSALDKQAAANAAGAAVDPGLTTAILTSSTDTFAGNGDAVEFMVSLSPDRPAKVSFCVDAPHDVLYLGAALFGNSDEDRRRMGVQQPRRINNGSTECWTLDHMGEGDKFILLYPGIRKSSDPKSKLMPKLDIKPGKGFSIRSSSAAYRPLQQPVSDIKGQQVFAQDAVGPHGSSNGRLSSTSFPVKNTGKTVGVYTAAVAAGTHFAERGQIDNLQGNGVAPIDVIAATVPCFDGITCMMAKFDPSTTVWGGWYFLNGILAPTDRQPVANWGDRPNVEYDLADATVLQFWARGAVGGETVHFFVFGVGNTEQPFQPIELPQGPVTLTTTWTRYQIPLGGLELHKARGAFGWVANATDGERLPAPINFYLDNIQYVKARPDDSRFLVSNETITSTESFDVVLRSAASVYDNSVSLIAMISSGDLADARTIAEALVNAQGRDRLLTDRRVRNAYQGGDISLPPGWLPKNKTNTVGMPGWYDAGHQTWFEDSTSISNTGSLARTGLALLNIWEATKDPKYLTAAERLGNWALLNRSEERSGTAGILGGFTAGYEGWENGALIGNTANCANGVLVSGQRKLLYKSTEDNIDLYAMFSRLYLADGESQWADAAQRAQHFFLAMWDPQGCKFWTGTTEDGATISSDVIPLDIEAWAAQTLGSEAQAYFQGFSYLENRQKTSQNSCSPRGDRTSFEGASQAAIAYLLGLDKARWQSVLDDVYSVQTASGTRATGPYSPALSVVSVAFANQSVGTQGSAHVISFTNWGVVPLSIRGVALTGPNASDFQQSNTCGSSLPSGGTCTITVSFVPSGMGARRATLTITESPNAAIVLRAHSVSLSGNDVAFASAFTPTLSSVPQVPTIGIYAPGTQVYLTAVPAKGSAFAGWSGDSLDSRSSVIMRGKKPEMANIAGVPTIQLGPIPHYGAPNEVITGTVANVTPSDYQIAVLALLSGQGWFSKPYCTSTTNGLHSDGSFSTLLTTGGVDQVATRIALLVVPTSLALNCYTSASSIPPQLIQHAIAEIVIARPNFIEREIEFAGQSWVIKSTSVPVKPGTCVFSDSLEDISVDGNGNLHLKIANGNENWSCSETHSAATAGQEIYPWTIVAAPALGPTTVFGAFIWADAELSAREFDVEFGFDKSGDPTNAQFVLQPALQPGSLRPLTTPAGMSITSKTTQHKYDSADYSQTFGGLRAERFLKVDTPSSNHPASSPLSLRVRVLNDGGAKLSVESMVAQNPTPMPSKAPEKRCSAEPLRVRVLNSGGAKLRITSVMSPNEGHRDQERCADQDGVGIALATSLQSWRGRREAKPRGSANQSHIGPIGDFERSGVNSQALGRSHLKALCLAISPRPLVESSY
jgi:hypothetical protein